VGRKTDPLLLSAINFSYTFLPFPLILNFFDILIFFFLLKKKKKNSKNPKQAEFEFQMGQGLSPTNDSRIGFVWYMLVWLGKEINKELLKIVCSPSYCVFPLQTYL
jgi:hypothetical protein